MFQAGLRGQDQAICFRPQERLALTAFNKDWTGGKWSQVMPKKRTHVNKSQKKWNGDFLWWTKMIQPNLPTHSHDKWKLIFLSPMAKQYLALPTHPHFYAEPLFIIQIAIYATWYLQARGDKCWLRPWNLWHKIYRNKANVDPLQAEPPQCWWSTSNTGSTKLVKLVTSPVSNLNQQVVEVAFVPTRTKKSFWQPSCRPPVRRRCQPWPLPRDASWRPDVGWITQEDESRSQDRVLKMERLEHTDDLYHSKKGNQCTYVYVRVFVCVCDF